MRHRERLPTSQFAASHGGGPAHHWHLVRHFWSDGSVRCFADISLRHRFQSGSQSWRGHSYLFTCLRSGHFGHFWMCAPLEAIVPQPLQQRSSQFYKSSPQISWATANMRKALVVPISFVLAGLFVGFGVLAWPIWKDKWRERIMIKRMGAAMEYVKKIAPMLVRDQRFSGVDIHAWGKDGILIMVTGSVRNALELADLKLLVQTNSPPRPVEWRISLSGMSRR
jgi:hypothetical protein